MMVATSLSVTAMLRTTRATQPYDIDVEGDLFVDVGGWSRKQGKIPGEVMQSTTKKHEMYEYSA